MNKLLLLFIIISMTSCGWLDRQQAHYTGKPSEICHDNVVYLQFTSGVTPKYGVNGLIVTCGK